MYDPEPETDTEYVPDAEYDAEEEDRADGETDTLPVRLDEPETLAVVE